MRRFDSQSKQALTLEEYIDIHLPSLPDEVMLREQWDKLPICSVGYDSTVDTLLHIKRVAGLLSYSACELIRRGNIHDASKLNNPEKELYDELTPLLSGSTYGSDQYKDFLVSLKPALSNHYKNNSHHPEHYENGIDGFDLFDLIEMLMDWKAASERHADGDILKSIEINKKRFNISDQLVSVLENTVKRFLIS